MLKEAAKHPEASSPLLSWYRIARKAGWKSLDEVRMTFPSADQVGDVLIFNVKGNRFRLITRVYFGNGRIYVNALLTHAEYDRRGWMKWA